LRKEDFSLSRSGGLNLGRSFNANGVMLAKRRAREDAGAPLSLPFFLT